MLFQCTSCTQEDVLIHDPRMLDCGHLICLGCVPKETSNGIICCPKCSRDTVVPPGGIGKLYQGSLLKQLTDLLASAEQPCSVCKKPATSKCTRSCNRVLCSKCLKRKSNGCKHENDKPITMHCPSHSNFLISEYCSECSRLLCTRCITEDTCSKRKINIQESSGSLFCKTSIPQEDLLTKRSKLEQLRKELIEKENQVLENTRQMIEMILKTEMVIVGKLKHSKQSINEQLESTNILLNRESVPPSLNNSTKSNGPAIRLLMDRLQLQMLEININSPLSKIDLTTGSVKPSKLTIFHDNGLYAPASNDSAIDNLDSWHLNDAYEYVSTNGRYLGPLGDANGFKKPDISWTKNSFYVDGDECCKCGKGCNSTQSKIAQPKFTHNALGPQPMLPARQHNKTSSPDSTKKMPPVVPPKPGRSPERFNLNNSLTNGFDQPDSATTPHLDANFIEFAENAEDYSYLDDYSLERYKTIDWTYPPRGLKNWTKDTSRILVTPDGQTILSCHTGPTTKIWAFNDCGQQRRQPLEVNYRVLDMTYSPLHKAVVLLESKLAHFMDVDDLSEKWTIQIPTKADGESTLLNCAMLHKGYLLILYETGGKLKFCIAELSNKGYVQGTAFSYVTSNGQHMNPCTKLQVKTDSLNNIYIINKEKQKIVIINSQCKFRPLLPIPPSCSSKLPKAPNPGIFLTCDGKVGYVESKADDTFVYYWIDNVKETIHLAENMDQLICVGPSGLHVYNKDSLFSQGIPGSVQSRVRPPLTQSHCTTRF